ncbi:MAG: Imm27 family immunity protein [Acidobacteriota bacterium]
MQNTKKLKPDENELIGTWIEIDGKVIGDAVSERIEFLTENYLEKIGFGAYGAWEILYRDSQDGRFWERTFPHSGWQGGGPPALINLSESEAKAKYPDLFK